MSNEEELVEAIYENGVFIPIKKIDLPNKTKVLLKITKLKEIGELQLLSYLKLLKEGEDAEELFKL